MAALLRGKLSRMGRHRALPLLLHGKARFNVLVETYVAAGVSLLCGSCGGYLLASTLYTQRLQQHMATHTERLAKETERRASSEGQLQRLDKELTALRAAQRVADMDTGAFLKSLTVPHTLGRWGELSLRRIVELSGMQQHVDFDEQITVLDKEGDVFRVDMVVKMHSKRYIVVDSKVPLNAFEETLAAKDEKEERAKMKKYSAAIRKHVLELSNKKYFNHFDPSPDFVVAFLPCEAFYSVALREDPGIIEYCLDKKVVLASPVTLIALLKVIEFGWRQGDLAENHEEIKGIIKEQYDRALSFSKHFADVGRSLDTAVRRYNDAVGSLESRLLASTRKMKVLGAIGGDDIPDAATVDRPIRPHHPPAEDDEDRPLAGAGAGAGAGAVAAALSAGSAGKVGADVSASAQRKAPRAPRTPAPP